ncbi:unnamed protein product [Acanthoscelides obtectus]|nr:unnamed protein product [Acanthoscelides obtectus]CAK1648347.1 hypothetical protein AOBTE_LOCUS15687 [Acanthoscelides obtectus]
MRCTRSRTNSSSGIGETDFVLLQSSPVGHMHWQPVSISVAGNSESLSDHSSRCSSQQPSPIPERKTSTSSTQSLPKPAEKPSKRHVVIRTDYTETNPRVSLSTTNTTVMYEQKVSNKTPLLHEYKHTASQTKSRPSSLPLKPSLRNRSKSIDNSQKDEKKEKKSFESLHRLKEKLLYSSPDLNETSDNESTPLVSEVSTPSKSGQSSEAKTSSSKSFPLSPESQRSLSPEKPLTKFTRSEMNLTETTELSPTGAFSDSQIFLDNQDTYGANDYPLTPDYYHERKRTLSDGTSTSVSAYLVSLDHSHSNHSIHSCSQSSGHLSRQNALDSEENLTDVYCEPGSKKD